MVTMDDEQVPAFLLKGAARSDDTPPAPPKREPTGAEIGVAARAHAEALHELTDGQPGAATTADLGLAMRAALMALYNDAR